MSCPSPVGPTLQCLHPGPDRGALRAGVAELIGQQAELGLGRFHPLAAHQHLAPIEINRQVLIAVGQGLFRPRGDCLAHRGSRRS